VLLPIYRELVRTTLCRTYGSLKLKCKDPVACGQLSEEVYAGLAFLPLGKPTKIGLAHLEWTTQSGQQFGSDIELKRLFGHSHVCVFLGLSPPSGLTAVWSWQIGTGEWMRMCPFLWTVANGSSPVSAGVRAVGFARKGPGA